MENVNISKNSLVKIVSGIIITCVIAAALIGIGLLFKVIEYSDILGNVLLSLLTVFIAGLFLLNSINAITVGNKLGIFAAFMIVVSALLFFVLIWANQYLGTFGEVFSYIIVSVSMLSVLLNLIVSNYIALGKSLIFIQIILYLCFAYVELAVSLAIFGNTLLTDLWQVLVTAIIVILTLFIVLKVKQKNIAQKAAVTVGEKGDYVTITKTEYENLKAEIERLRELTKTAPVEPAPVNADKE